jgi:hypothetical protein
MSVPVLPVTGVIFSTVGLVLLIAAGTGPAEWWNWESSPLGGTKPTGDVGYVELWRQHPVFRVASLVTVAGAVGVVAAQSPHVFRTALIVFSLSAAVLFGIAADWPGMSILTAVGLIAAIPYFIRFCYGDRTAICRVGSNRESVQANCEPLLATLLCVVFAWALPAAIHRSATLEAGPAVADSDRVPAIPRAVRAATRQANLERNAHVVAYSSMEAWLLGICLAVIVMAGLFGGGGGPRQWRLYCGLAVTAPDHTD